MFFVSYRPSSETERCVGMIDIKVIKRVLGVEREKLIFFSFSVKKKMFHNLVSTKNTPFMGFYFYISFIFVSKCYIHRLIY